MKEMPELNSPDSFDEKERVGTPLADRELTELRDRTVKALRESVDEATRRLFSPETPFNSRADAERVLKVHIHNLAQATSWEEAERYGKEAEERYATRRNAAEQSGASGALSKTTRVLRSWFSSF